MQQQYFDNPAIGQSRLKKILYHVNSFVNFKDEQTLYYEEKDHFIIGSAVDCKITRPEAFDQEYYIDDLATKPSDTIMSIVKYVKDTSDHVRLEDARTEILNSCNIHKYNKTFKDDTRIDKVISSGKDYFDLLIASNGKMILSKEEMDTVNNIYNSFYANETIAKILNHKECINQLEIYFTIDDLKYKAMLDKVLIDHRFKTITPIDIKTLHGHTSYFPENARKFRYDFQAAFYIMALKEWSLWEGYSDYKINPFLFIVETSMPSAQGSPMIYQCSNDFIQVGMHGKHNDTVNIYGVDTALMLHKWYEENGYQKDYKEKDTLVLLNWEKSLLQW
jgi:hypothetical protein